MIITDKLADWKKVTQDALENPWLTVHDQHVAEFIRIARIAMPQLISEVERLQRLVEALTSARSHD